MVTSIKYDRNQPYNQLPLLPPSTNKILTIEILQAVNKANKALAELKGVAHQLPNQGMLINTLALREAKASTEIENIFTTDDELYKALSADNEKALQGGAKEVLRYREALWKGYKLLKKPDGFTIKLIIEVYRKVQQTTDSIRPPQANTVIKKRGNDSLGGTVIYTPPRGEKVIEQKLSNLIDFMNDDNTYDYDPLLKLAIAHYQFEAIHPFRDGNGRCGRILNTLFMIQKKLLDVPILYLSAYIINNKEDYYAYLNNVTTRNNWTDWILYMMEAIEETARYTIKNISEITQLFEKTEKLIAKKHPHIPTEAIEAIFEQPYCSPKRLIGERIKSINTAKKYLQQMEALGIMVTRKIGKETVYLNSDLFNMLAEM